MSICDPRIHLSKSQLLVLRMFPLAELAKRKLLFLVFPFFNEYRVGGRGGTKGLKELLNIHCDFPICCLENFCFQPLNLFSILRLFCCLLFGGKWSKMFFQFGFLYRRFLLEWGSNGFFTQRFLSESLQFFNLLKSTCCLFSRSAFYSLWS